MQEFVETIEATKAAAKNFIVGHRRFSPAFEHAIDADAFEALKLCVVQIDIVNHLADLNLAWVDDVKVAVDGWPMPPFMGFGKWAAFTKGEHHEAMVMGTRFDSKMK